MCDEQSSENAENSRDVNVVAPTGFVRGENLDLGVFELAGEVAA